PISGDLKENADRLHARWARFRSKDMSVEEFRELSRDLDGFLNQAVGHAGDLHGKLNEVMMAQDYQDLTGQIIRRVISLVQEVEDKLVSLIRISGQERLQKPADEAAEKNRMMRGLARRYLARTPSTWCPARMMSTTCCPAWDSEEGLDVTGCRRRNSP